MGAVNKEMEKHKTNIRRGRTETHWDQVIVERHNRTLTERLFGHQYAVETAYLRGSGPPLTSQVYPTSFLLRITK